MWSNPTRPILSKQRPRVHPSPEFKRFALEERLGQGSTGTVWKAFDTRLKRFVALKVPHHPSENTSKTYLREARAASRLSTTPTSSAYWKWAKRKRVVFF